MTIAFNYRENEISSSPTAIVSGSTSATRLGVVEFVNNSNAVFPPQYAEINNGQFKALLHLSPGAPNVFEVTAYDNGTINGGGFAEFRPSPGRSVDRGRLTLLFNELRANKPVHLCVIVGRDSAGAYDMPSYRTQRGEVANLDSAVRKLKVAGRLMQAFTQDDFRVVGLSNRSFQFVEEEVSNQGLFGYTSIESPTPHREIKVHVLRSPKTVAQLRDPNLAQQNPNASDSGGLFSHAIDLIRDTPDLYGPYRQKNTAIQCAVIYLDAHFDTKSQLILTHAALGGGTGEVKLAIFGSHGLHSWPANFPQVGPSFVDATQLSTREVANDCNQCGTSWECLNITLGAFMHEIGHLMGSPHQVDGVMLRDYIWWNRSFMTREARCLRTGSSGEIIGPQGTWPKVCHWNILDLLRYLQHDSFSLPPDKDDPSFGKTLATRMALAAGSDRAPTLYNTPGAGAYIKSDTGIFLVEFITEDLARHHYSYLPKMYGGPGPRGELTLDYDQCYQELRRRTDKASEHYDVRVLSFGGDLFIKDFKKNCADSSSNVINSDFGLGRGPLTGYKSSELGQSKGRKDQFIGFNINSIYKIRVYAGSALDGVRFYFTLDAPAAAEPPKVPKRDYLSKFKSMTLSNPAPGGAKEATIGNEKPHYVDFDLGKGETITKFHFRNGAWIDAIQFELSSGRLSPWFGNATGGHHSTLEAPSDKYEVIGMYGCTGSWMDSVGIIYTNK